ncbi:MAG: ferritin family protein [Sphaerochaetaceae bacterium]
MDLFDVAIKMEIEGATFYRDLAARTPSEGIKKIFTMLAEDEDVHKATFEAMQKETAMGEMRIDAAVTKAAKIFKALDKKELLDEEHHLDLYQHALDIELKSIDFYSEQYEKLSDEKQKAALEKIIEEERKHYDLIDDIMVMLEHPERWVEAAEFGVRDEY